ncbi:MAG: PTS N-acetylgalactosamine transporter subunit IIB [Actinomycetes bacterium]|jgi:PTS system galactosamine-specific IIB component|nr:PTS N-acetylgalactosamine transporter subunit IIB [Actinomycetes bacterium]
MPIRLTRIDNRLIHGQVVGIWAGAVGANLIVVADDEVAASDMERQVMKIAADALSLDSRFFTVQQTIDVIDRAAPSQKILLMCKTPRTVRRILEGGVQLDTVNIGNMHPGPGREHIAGKVYVTAQDRDDLDFIKTRVRKIYIQDTPEQKVDAY